MEPVLSALLSEWDDAPALCAAARDDFEATKTKLTELLRPIGETKSPCGPLPC